MVRLNSAFPPWLPDPAGERTLAVEAEVGGVALAIGAKDERAAGWYERFGARLLLSAPLKLILPLRSMAEAIRIAGKLGSEPTDTVACLTEPPRFDGCDPRVPVSARLVSSSRHHRQPGTACSIGLDDLADGRFKLVSTGFAGEPTIKSNNNSVALKFINCHNQSRPVSSPQLRVS